MPSDFCFPSAESDLWVPLHLDPGNRDEYWHNDFMPVVGRLRPGANLVEARVDLRALRSYVLTIFPWRMPDNWNAATTVIPLRQETVGEVRTKLLALLGVVGLILLIACANVANLLLARSTTRQKEIAVRAALGAGRWRIIRQLLTESVVAALAGGSLGLVFAAGGLSLLKAILPVGTPRLAEVALDGRVMGFTAALAVLTGLIFGSAPAVYASRAGLSESLKTGWLRSTGGVSGRLCSGIVAAEVALAVVVITGAGLLIRSFWRLIHVDPGFRTEQIVTARLTPNGSFCEEPGRCVSFYNNLLTQAGGLPGVTDAAAINILPLSGSVSGSPTCIEDHPVAPGQPAPIAWQSAITPRYLHVMGIQLLKGRVFTEADGSEAPPVALVSASTARRFWPGQNPVGKRIKPVWQDRWQTVVGVVSNVRQYDMVQETPDWVDGGVVYVPYAQAVMDGRLPTSAMTLVLRTSSDRLQVSGELRRLVASLNSNVPVSQAKAMGDIVSASVAAQRSTMRLFVIFAALAMALASVGIYSVLAYAVTQRTHEIGVRMMLGAGPRDLLRLVIGKGMFLALVGLSIGAAGALVLMRFLASLLYGVRPMDPITFLAVSLVLTGVALAASYLPARRATRVDPLVAMRYE